MTSIKTQLAVLESIQSRDDDTLAKLPQSTHELLVDQSTSIDQLRTDAITEERYLERNLKDVFIVQSFSWYGLSFLEDGQYIFSPRVNVLLEKDGYGKTVLLRALVALLQRNHLDVSFVILLKFFRSRCHRGVNVD